MTIDPPAAPPSLSAAFDFSNSSGRAPGPFITLLARVLPGVAQVQTQVEPFAAAWGSDNRAALADRAERAASADRVVEPVGPGVGDGGGAGRSVPLWVAIGDSLTLGVGASAHDRGWVGQLAARLGAPDALRVVNLGISGATVRDVLEREVPVLAALQPDLVTLMVGSNNLMRPKERQSLPGEMRELLLALAALPGATVVTTLPNPTRPALAANRVVLEMAAAHGFVVAELRDPRTTSWRGKLAPDHFHPNDRGYAAIADVLVEPVLRALPVLVDGAGGG